MSFRLSAPNGMNLSRSVHNPKSRFRRMMDYLSVKGEATREDILRDVFGKVIGVNQFEYNPTTGWKRIGNTNFVTRGWGCYVFSLSIKYGFIKMVRRGNKVFYSNA